LVSVVYIVRLNFFGTSNTENINCTTILPAVLLWMPPIMSVTCRC